MEVFVGPSHLKGSITPPPSKSLAHRVLIATALAGAFREDVGLGQDVDATRQCLAALLGPGDEPVVLDCRESGSTLRFLLPLAAALGRSALFVGSSSLARRPLREYEAIFADKGVTLEFLGSENLPVKVEGKLRGGRFAVPGHVSSQYITGLLLALPLLEEDSSIVLTSKLQSAPYVALTQGVLEQFGVVVQTMGSAEGLPTGWRVPGGQQYRLPEKPLELEADYSQAAFWLVARFLGHKLTVEGLAAESLQGDQAVADLLEQLKCCPEDRELRIDVSQVPDLVPALAVASGYRRGVTVLAKAERLRFKESDRLLSTSQMLVSLGGEVSVSADALIIKGLGRLVGGVVDSHNDHRIAMAAAIAALNSEQGVRILGSEAVEKSYPKFFQELQRLGGDVRGI